MKKNTLNQVLIRPACEDEYEVLGKMTVQVYEQLPGMPTSDQQPDYYAMLFDVGSRAAKPSIEILVAATPKNEVLGGVTFVGDMKFYDSGGTASSVPNSSGIRLLAVKPDARGFGVGRKLTDACILRARKTKKSKVILHTTKSMETAWGLYLRMGFLRSPDLDFMQGKLEVFGFSLHLR